MPVLRNANLMVEARERTATSESERLNHRGQLPLIEVAPPQSVGAAQLAALGFKRIPAGAAGIPVQTRLHDSSGTWRNFYVFDPQTHFIRFEMERLELDKVPQRVKAK